MYIKKNCTYGSCDCFLESRIDDVVKVEKPTVNFDSQNIKTCVSNRSIYHRVLVLVFVRFGIITNRFYDWFKAQNNR